MADSPTTKRYTMTLCGDCSYGPPCRCSDDLAIVNRVWSGGAWRFVATCTTKETSDG
jgi:hypothetical protein